MISKLNILGLIIFFLSIVGFVLEIKPTNERRKLIKDLEGN